MNQSIQATYFDAQHDYWSASPHLKHRHLYERLLGLIRDEVLGGRARGVPSTVLEVGAGDGAITERLLALGYAVTGTEVSDASADKLSERFRANANFRCVHDPAGDLSALGAERFWTIIFSSVLHHIPDYLAALRDAVSAHLMPRGTLITVQDPLWYSRLSTPDRLSSSAAYLSWRIFRGDLAGGIAAKLRRIVHGAGEVEARDVIEYHVVRDGVDESAIRGMLSSTFADVEVISYWSTQGSLQQRLGERFGLKNTFAVRARDYRA